MDGAVRLTLATLFVLAALPLDAAVFQVTKTADTLDSACDADCSLREAVTAANARMGLDVVQLDAGVYALTRAGAEENNNGTGDFDVRDDLVILGAGADRTAIDGGQLDRVLEVHDSGSLEMQGVTVRNGRARAGGAQVHPAGGGIRADGPLTLAACFVTGNRADSSGGGIYATREIQLRDSTIADNESGDYGGGVFAGAFGEPVMRLVNVTVSGNHAPNGGGLFVFDGDSEISHLTVTRNTADFGGGLYLVPLGCIPEDPVCNQPTRFVMNRSVLAANTAAQYPDCVDILSNTGGHNLFGIDTGCPPGPTDRAGTAASPLDPQLSALGDYGGHTPTHLPLPGSPAIDLAPAADCSGHDQRGEPRPNGPACDAGSVERSEGCRTSADALCLGAGSRFRVTSTWTALGTSGAGRALPLALDTGAFWFFGPDNLEIQIKVLDGCGVNQRFWVFVTGLTDVGVELIVEDTATGESWMYGHAAGTTFPTVTDTNAFATCSEVP